MWMCTRYVYNICKQCMYTILNCSFRWSHLVSSLPTWRSLGIYDNCNKTAPNINHAVVLDGFGSEKLGLDGVGSHGNHGTFMMLDLFRFIRNLKDGCFGVAWLRCFPLLPGINDDLIPIWAT